MKTLLCVLGIVAALDSGAQFDYLGQKPPGDEPEVFAAGLVSRATHEHSSPAFAPDGMEVYWSFFENQKQTIVFSRLERGKWTGPSVAPFSGTYSDGGPCFTRDGRRLYFYSERPLPGAPGVLRDDLWYVERRGAGWSEPANAGISDLSGREKWIYSPSVADNGNVYVAGRLGGGHGLYVLRAKGGRLSAPVALPDQINSGYDRFNWTPFIAPDESYLLFSSKRSDSHGFNDLYVSFRRADGSWSRPVNLGEKVNGGGQMRFPVVSRDGRFLFFTGPNPPSRDDVYWVDAGLIERLRRQAAGEDRTRK
jgi:hypothetical protein